MQVRRVDLICVLFIYSLDAFGIAVVYPIFTDLFFGPTAVFLTDSSLFFRTISMGILIAAFPIAQFFGAPLIGDCSDRIGRKKALTVTLFAGTCCYFLIAIGIFFSSFPLLLASRMMSGFFAGNASICLATLSEFSQKAEQRAKYFGILAACSGICFLISVAVGDFFSNQFSPGIPFFLMGSLSLLIFFLVLIFFQDLRSHTNHARFSLKKGLSHIFSTLKNPDLQGPYLLYFFFTMAWSSAMQFYPSTLEKLYQRFEIGTNLIVIGIVWSTANFFIQRVVSKIATPYQTLLCTIPILVMFFLSLLLPQNFLSFSIHFSIATFFAALVWTNSITYVSTKAPLEIQGRILGINQSFSALASLLGALCGSLFTAIYVEGIFIFDIIALCFAFYFLKRSTK